MYIGLPFLIAVIPSILAILLTWWFRKRNLSLFVRLLPSILILGGSFYSFYYGYEIVRGFEGGMFLVLAFFLMCFSVVGFFVANTKPTLK